MFNFEETPKLFEHAKKTILESAEKEISVAAIIESAGYKGARGITWGCVLGIIAAAAHTLGAKMTKVGRRYIVIKSA